MASFCRSRERSPLAKSPKSLRRSAEVSHSCLPEVTQTKNAMGNEKAGDLPDIIHAEGEFCFGGWE